MACSGGRTGACGGLLRLRFRETVIAKDKMNQGVLKYNQGDNASAKDYFKSATEYVPNEAVAWLYYGATLVKDYKAQTGDERDADCESSHLRSSRRPGPRQRETASSKRAAMAYIAAIYEDLGNDDAWREWMVKRAESQCADNTLKARNLSLDCGQVLALCVRADDPLR